MNKYHWSIFIYSFCLSTLTLRGPFPVSLSVPFSIGFVQRGFVERATFQARFLRVGRGFTVVGQCMGSPRYDSQFHRFKQYTAIDWPKTSDLRGLLCAVTLSSPPPREYCVMCWVSGICFSSTWERMHCFSPPDCEIEFFFLQNWIAFASNCHVDLKLLSAAFLCSDWKSLDRVLCSWCTWPQ